MSWAKGFAFSTLLFLMPAALSALVGADSDASETGIEEPAASTDIIHIDGSTTVFPLIEDLVRRFRDKNPDTEVRLAESSSSRGIAGLLDGSVDVAMAARPITREEDQAFADIGASYIELPIARAAVAVIANSENRWLAHLTIDDLQKIWCRDEVTTWNQVRPEGPADPLVREAPQEDSGTVRIFLDAIGEEVLVTAARRHETPAAVVEAVAEDPAAVGLVLYQQVPSGSESVRVLPIDEGFDEPVAPSLSTLGNASYPLGGQLWLYLRQEASRRPEVSALVTFLLDEVSDRVEGYGMAALGDPILDGARRRFENRTAGSVMLSSDLSALIEGYFTTMTVVAASRRPESILDAPVAVSAILPEQIERQAALGSVPKLFEPAAGADFAQSGMFDFKLNVRGINATNSRRTGVLIDGRNPAIAINDLQEWAAVAFPVDDLVRAELLRGPSSALYGANAFNGVLNLVTKSARDSVGGTLRLTAGEQSTRRAELRWATPLGDGGWYFKGVGTYLETDDFYRSRNETLEYTQPCPPGVTAQKDCLALEAVPLPLDGDRALYAGIRVERDFGDQRSLVAEGGWGSYDGATLIGAGTRLQYDGSGSSRPWARFDFSARHWNLLASSTGRDAEAVNLVDGEKLYTDSTVTSLELEAHSSFSAGRGRVVGRVTLGREEVSTANPLGVQTLISEKQDVQTQGLSAQLEYELNDRMKLVFAGRWDDSDLHDPQLSPQAALIFAVTPEQTLRFSYREAFLTPAYTDYFVVLHLAPSLDLSPFEGFCAPYGVECGFDRPVDILAVGNPDLSVETISTAEVGYSAVFSGRSFVNLEIYRSEAEDFVQRNGVPQVGTLLGRINPDYGPYTPPSGLPPAAAAALLGTLEAVLGPQFPFLSNPAPDEPVLALFSLANAGRIKTQGVELSVDHWLNRSLSLSFNYAWLDFDALEGELPQVPGLAPVAANSPEHRFNAGIAYTNERWNGSLKYRWVDEFRWADGLVRGTVPSYSVVNLAVRYRISDTWSAGVNVSNLLDDVHYELFGGDLMRRQALFYMGVTW